MGPLRGTLLETQRCRHSMLAPRPLPACTWTWTPRPPGQRQLQLPAGRGRQPEQPLVWACTGTALLLATKRSAGPTRQPSRNTTSDPETDCCCGSPHDLALAATTSVVQWSTTSTSPAHCCPPPSRPLLLLLGRCGPGRACRGHRASRSSHGMRLAKGGSVSGKERSLAAKARAAANERWEEPTASRSLQLRGSNHHRTREQGRRACT